MKKIFVFLAAFITLISCTSAQSKKSSDATSIFDFTVKSLEGNDIALSDYKGKIVLIVNTASKCGFTPQYEGLQTLYEKYKDKGFVILGFPCNQFAHQEPGTAKEIKEFCSINYGVTFQMFEKIDVNGDNESPLYTYLKSGEKGGNGKKIKWNFTKFLIGKDGKVIERFGSSTKPEDIDNKIVEVL